MAIYGIGAFYRGIGDVSEDFIEREVVGVGWNSKEAPELQEFFKSLKVGDLVYIKSSFGGSKSIIIKAVGIIRNNVIIRNNNLVSTGRKVKWLSKERFVIPKPKEKNNVRSNTVYEEFHPKVLKEIISRIK